MTRSPHRSNTGLKWGLVGVGALAVVLVVVLAAVLVRVAAGTDERFDPRPLDRSEATAAFADRDVVVPPEFQFVRARLYPVFSGRETVEGRYRLFASLEHARMLVAEANPSFPGFVELTCADEDQRSLAKIAGLSSCPPAEAALASVRHSLPGHVDPPPDSETLVLAVDGTAIELTVYANGH